MSLDTEKAITIAQIASALELRRACRIKQITAIKAEATADHLFLAELMVLAINGQDESLIKAFAAITAAVDAGTSETAAILINKNPGSNGLLHKQLGNEFLPLISSWLGRPEKKTDKVLPKKKEAELVIVPKDQIRHLESKVNCQLPAEHAPIAKQFAETHPAFGELINLAKAPHIQKEEGDEQLYINPRLLMCLFVRNDGRPNNAGTLRVAFSTYFNRWLERHNVELKMFVGGRKTGYISEANAVRFLTQIEYVEAHDERHVYTIRKNPFDPEEKQELGQWLSSGKLRRG